MSSKRLNKPLTGTYRIQLTSDFGFAECEKIVQYLYNLGISHIYFSPYFQAETGSTSGYDVVDSQNINEELGGKEGLEKLRKVMSPMIGQVLDIVPNHTSILSERNKLWMDVLKYGRKSKYAKFFDIDWNPPQKRLAGKVLLPVLGEHYERELHSGHIQLTRLKDDFFVTYYSYVFPVNAAGARKIKKGTQAKTDEEIAKLNSCPKLLDEILNVQFYFLSHWEAADKEINYRRFFSINSLIGMRVEDSGVFDYAHKSIFQMIGRRQLDGVRVDHIDGLRNPVEYLKRLRSKARHQWILVEKILGAKETIPKEWPVDGTTGYDFLNIVNGLFVNPAAKEGLSNLYRQLTGETRMYSEMLYKKKLLTIEKSFGGELTRLAAMLEQIAMRHRPYRDLNLSEIKEGLSILIAYFPVYRTYITDFEHSMRDEDAEYIGRAIWNSREKNPQVHEILWEFFKDLFAGKLNGKDELEFVLRFQQLTGPIMAKGAEDTAFYCFNDLISLNEVGGEPSKFGTSVKEFHEYCLRTQRDRPLTMLTTSTHDTKRSEDVRMRINMISEIWQQWEQTVRKWFEENKKYRSGNSPDANTEYLLYQTLVGCWPIETQRINDYIIKAVREEKVRTSWTKVKEGYEEGLVLFIEKILKDGEFVRSLEWFIGLIIRAARISSLSQVLIKYTAPGVPDLYQGTELWDISLVDPDNRRPVDYQLRKNIFYEMEMIDCKGAFEEMESGQVKMYVIYHCLKVRREHLECFGEKGSYEPIGVSGAKAENVIAFRRGGKIVTVAPRMLMSLGDPPDWQDTAIELGEGRWVNEFTKQIFEGDVEMKNLLNDFPLALLVKEK